MQHSRHIAVIGLGYVGLPVAATFAQQCPVIGFDIDTKRITELKTGFDRTREIHEELLQQTNLQFTDQPADLAAADFYIIAVPTPVDAMKTPDLSPVLKASKTVAHYLQPGDVVVYESTVYPGATEETCVPVLEKYSGLQCGQGFKVGYSPERINPGDKTHHFTSVTKVVSGQDEETLTLIAQVYETVVTAGVYRASSIKVAEASKVIENIQRDVNIALINELAMIFNRLQIDTHEVLTAAGTKWNFLPFTPGLVGGHCIGVDPYYLNHKAQSVGYQPKIIPASRQINDGMGFFIAQEILVRLARSGCLIAESTVTIVGFAFKENVGDLRNTRVIDIIENLQKQGVNVQVIDDLVDADQVKRVYGISILMEETLQPADCVVLAVAHAKYLTQGWGWITHLLQNQTGLVIDIKGKLSQDDAPSQVDLWRL